MDYDKGNRIRLYEMLYSQYSKLKFTKAIDRPIAISGAEKRLTQTLNTPGGYGVLHRYLHRGLLWRKAETSTELRLRFIRDQRFPIPSWSWMAYDSAIRYMDIPFGRVDWNKEEIKSPFSNLVNKEDRWFTGNADCITITATVYPREKVALEKRSLIFDDRRRTSEHGLYCVIVGIQKSRLAWDKYHRTHYVLLVQRKCQVQEAWVYHRVGVGTLEARDIKTDGVDKGAYIR